MSTLQVLIEARKLIEWRWRWRQELYATCFGIPCSPRSALATSRCARGAMLRVCGRNAFALDAAVSAFCDANDQDPIGFNDTHTHAEVLAAFDKAIAAERAKVQP